MIFYRSSACNACRARYCYIISVRPSVLQDSMSRSYACAARQVLISILVLERLELDFAQFLLTSSARGRKSKSVNSHYAVDFWSSRRKPSWSRRGRDLRARLYSSRLICVDALKSSPSVAVRPPRADAILSHVTCTRAVTSNHVTRGVSSDI